MAITFIGCNSDDDNSTPPTDNKASILGKWYYNNIIVDGEVIPYDDHEECGKDYIEFYDVDKMRAIDVWDCEEDLDFQGNFTLTDNTLTIIEGGDSVSVEIIELSATKLSYSYSTDLDETVIENFDRE